MERIEKSTAGLPDGWHVEVDLYATYPQLYSVFAHGVCVAWAFDLHYSDELHVKADDPVAQKVVLGNVQAHKRAVEVQRYVDRVRAQGDFDAHQEREARDASAAALSTAQTPL